jgi:ketosteroid isomerase-like protein
MTSEVVTAFFEIQAGKRAGKIEDLFADKVDWDLPGNESKFPWVGKRHTKQEVAAFFADFHRHIEPVSFEVQFCAFEGEHAVAVGSLTSKILKYDKLFSTAFTATFKVQEGKIVKYHFLEESYKLNEMMN